MPYPYYYSGPMAAFSKRRQQSNPYFQGQFQYQGPQEEAQFPQELDPYLGAQAIIDQLAQHKKDARAQAFLGAGSAMLGADDLMSGLSAAGQAFGEPMNEYRKEARELPGQAALARYGIMNDEQQRMTQQRQEERETGQYNTQNEEAAYRAGKPRQQAATAGDLQNENSLLQNELSRIGLKYSEDQIIATLRKMETDTASTEQSITSEQAELPGRIRLQGAQENALNAGAEFDRGEGRQTSSGYGGVTTTSATAARRMAQAAYLKEMDDMGFRGAAAPDIKSARGGMLMKLLQSIEPGSEGEYGQDVADAAAYLNDRELVSAGQMSPQELNQKWGGNEAAISVFMAGQFMEQKRSGDSALGGQR